MTSEQQLNVLVALLDGQDILRDAGGTAFLSGSLMTVRGGTIEALEDKGLIVEVATGEWEITEAGRSVAEDSRQGGEEEV